VGGGNWTDEQLKFGCAIAGGMAIVIFLLLFAELIGYTADGEKNDFNGVLVVAASALRGGACLGILVLLSLAFGYFVNRK
jgi:hypothetical protein